MANIEHWAKADALNVYQIALLLGGIDPSPLHKLPYSSLSPNTRDHVAVYLMLLTNAVVSGVLVPMASAHYDGGQYDWNETLIGLASLRAWLAARDMNNTVFAASTSTRSAPSQKFSQFYAPKLAAAVAAWDAVTSEPHRLRSRSPKQALEAWLTEHAAEYGLVNKDGSANKTGIEEVAKVANWRPKGGAPTTPTLTVEPTPSFEVTPSRVAENHRAGFGKWEDDGEIPF